MSKSQDQSRSVRISEGTYWKLKEISLKKRLTIKEIITALVDKAK